MKRIFLVAALLSNGLVAAINPATLGKIESGPCGEAATRESTAIWVAAAGKTFLLSTETAALTKGCHALVTADGKQALELVASDWGKGLALFAAHVAAPAVATLGDAAVTAGMPVEIAGYPAGSSALRTEKKGRLLSASSERHALATAETLYEVQGAFSDSGMKGGIIVDNNGTWIGIVAPQYLGMTPGKSTRPMEWDEKKGHWERLLFSLSAREAMAWVNAYVSTGSAPGLVRDPVKRQVHSDGLAAEIDCPPAEAPTDPGGPIGGTDGVGVGGDDTKEPFCKVKLTRSDIPSGAFPIASQAAWWSDLLRRVSAGESPEILFFTHRKAAGEMLERLTFRSLGEFFKLLKHREFLPARLSEGNVPPKVREQAAEVSKRASLFKDWTYSVANPLLMGLYFQLRVLATDRASELTAADVGALLDESGVYAQSWSAAKSIPFQAKMVAHFREGLEELKRRLP